MGCVKHQQNFFSRHYFVTFLYKKRLRVVLLMINAKEEMISSFLFNLGVRGMKGTIYDTAYVGSVKDILGNPRFPRHAKSVLMHQKNDGSWGANNPNTPFDNLVNTASVLSMMVELGYYKKPEYIEKFERGLSWLLDRHEKVFKSNFTYPTGFEFTYSKLFSNITEKISSHRTTISELEKTKNMKLKLLGKKAFTDYTPMLHSMEGVVDNEIDANIVANLVGNNNSLGNSPSSTTILLKYRVKGFEVKGVDYLFHSTTKELLVQTLNDFENFNNVYSLYPFYKSEIPISEPVKRKIDLIESRWIQNGLSLGKSFQIPDSDDTSIALLLLDKYSSQDSSKLFDVLENYRGDEYYYTYPFELGSSFVSNVHILEAALTLDIANKEDIIKKISGYLKKNVDKVLLNSKYIVSEINQICMVILAVTPFNEEITQLYLLRLLNLINDKEDKKEKLVYEEMNMVLFTFLYLLKHKMISMNYLDRYIVPYYILVKDRILRPEKYANKPLNEFWSGKVNYYPYDIVESFSYASVYLYDKIFPYK